ncbi:ABC transporter substrate-binding protein [Sulfurospirillum arcachonense]|uniref:ABC transporter substrate-binding protein n=1 Tax=Sulfurospirillum arcachonense TaxID=57666 RepID=UPI00046AD6E8|nr:ABC transporter substrate-binding protein [Sulfurospirillum arcachonense]
MKKIIVGLATAALLCSGANAKTLSVGMSDGAQSMDPYFINNDDTNSILNNVFDSLISFDKDLHTQANLAESWSNPSPKEWIFKLRKGVKFHNGSDFNADDVIFSYDRVRNWDKSAFKSKVNMIESVSKVDEYTIKMVTNKPYPIFLRQLTYVNILDKETLAGKSDQWIGLNPVGTGPYKFDSWNKGDSIKMSANNGYWLGKPTYDKVIFKPLTNAATRVAGILSGAVDIINKVPAVDVAKIKNNERVDFFMVPSLRTIYIHMDQHREKSPFIKSPTGKNPLQDIKVRQAFSYAIDRESITKYIMKGFAVTANQLNASTVYGYDKSIGKFEFNPEKAKALLKEAGYPNGFEIQLDSLNTGTYPKIAQAVASSLTRIGIKVKVNATPGSVFFGKMGKRETSFSLIGWASGSGDASSFLDSIVHSVNPDKGYGKYNWGNFANAKADELIEKSASTMNPEERLKELKEVQKIALAEFGYLPIHYTVNLYAANKKVHFEPRINGYIWAFDVK